MWGSQGHQESLDPKVPKARKERKVGNYTDFMSKLKGCSESLLGQQFAK